MPPSADTTTIHVESQGLLNRLGREEAPAARLAAALLSEVAARTRRPETAAPLRPSVRRHRPMRKRGTCQRNLRLFFVFELKVFKLGRVAKLARQQLELLGMEFTTLEVIERRRADDTRHARRRLMR